MSAPRIRGMNSPAHQINDAASHDSSHQETASTDSQGTTYYKARKYANSRGRINKPVNRRLKNLRRRSRSSPQNDTESEDLGYEEQSDLDEDKLGKIQESAMGGSNLGGLQHNDQGDLSGSGEDRDKTQQAAPESLHTSQLLAALQRKKRSQPRKTGAMQDLEHESDENLNNELASEIEDTRVHKAKKSNLDDFSTRAESTETEQSFSAFSTHRTQKNENVKDPSSSQEEEMKVPTVRPTNLQLALPEQQPTLSAQFKQIDGIAPEQRAVYALNQSIQALMNLRDKFAKDPSRASLRASIQALILRLLHLRLSKKLFTPIDLTSIRQILIDADEQRKKQDKRAQDQQVQQDQEEQKREQGEGEEAQKDEGQHELPQKVKTLNLLMPLLLLNSERPSTRRQLKRAAGRLKMLSRTAVKKTA